MTHERIEEILKSQKIKTFANLLLSYNKIHNISGAKNIDDINENIIDSIYALKYFDFVPKSAIDIGSGAGFPAIVLAIALENCEFTLHEPIAKKSAFLHLVKNELNLKNVKIETKRVEDSNIHLVELITSRAVGDTKFLIDISKGFYDENTLFLLYKGSFAKEETKEFSDVKIYERNLRKYVFLKGIK